MQYKKIKENMEENTEENMEENSKLSLYLYCALFVDEIQNKYN